MTKTEIEAQAIQYVADTYYVKDTELDIVKEFNPRKIKAFITGAKWGAEHAIEWHDLRKDPNDLPKYEEVLREYLVAYQNFNNPNEIVVGCFTWDGLRFLENYDYSEIPYFENKNVLYAWCELPHFKE